MLDYARVRPGEAFDRVVVTVTFLRLQRCAPPAVSLPADAVIEPFRPSVDAYRALYREVGARWLWWLRLMMPADLLARHLADQAVTCHVLRCAGEVAGFFELDANYWPDVNLNYFGLCPGFIGQGLGRSLLRAAIGEVFRGPARGMTVNTCTADHPNALPTYKAAGFHETRRVSETWDIPRRLGLAIPGHLQG
jgi:GNAT superfamily N-acetyltransferase